MCCVQAGVYRCACVLRKTTVVCGRPNTTEFREEQDQYLAGGPRRPRSAGETARRLFSPPAFVCTARVRICVYPCCCFCPAGAAAYPPLRTLYPYPYPYPPPPPRTDRRRTSASPPAASSTSRARARWSASSSTTTTSRGRRVGCLSSIFSSIFVVILRLLRRLPSRVVLSALGSPWRSCVCIAE